MISTRWIVLTGALFLGLAAGASAAQRAAKAEIPDVRLQPRDTWWETLLASREAPPEQEAAAEDRARAGEKPGASAASASLVAAVAEAFPSAVDFRQQRLEASAGIWKADWKRGDLAELAAQPYDALVNAANPGESRVLMAPLPVAAGGWGQIAKGAFSGKSDPGWQEMLKLVEGSVTPLENHDIAGTCGREKGCRCGGCKIRKEAAARQQTDVGDPQSSQPLSAAAR